MIRRVRSWLARWSAVVLALCASADVTASTGPQVPLLLSAEEQLVEAIDLARLGKAREGLDVLQQLTHTHPNFRLAQLIYAELLAMRSGRAVALMDPSDPRIRELFEEAQVRLDQARFTPPDDTVPSAVLQLSEEYPYLVVVDLPRSRLHLMRNQGGQLELVGSRYAAIGRGGYGKQVEGDLRTPVGLYHVTGWMSDAELPELYGTGALPLNYPNLWDLYKSKTGYGIWLHGVPRQTYVRGPRSSEGCVTMANDDLLWLKRYVVHNRAPVVLTDQLQWVPQRKAREEREVILQRVEDWRRTWAAKDTDALMGFYGEDLSAGGLSKTQFTPQRRKPLSARNSASIKLSDVSVFRYPGEAMLLVEFLVEYRDDDSQFTARKEQYWRKDAGGQWRIFREENR